MKPPKQLHTLDDLMAQAGDYAHFCLRNSGAMTATLFLIGDGGPMMVAARSLADEAAKDNFADLARLACIAHGATCCVMAMEAWLKTAKPGEALDLTEMPSEAFDRQEVVVLMGEDRQGQRQQFLPIVRSDNGRFFNLGESALPMMDSVEGRFAQILSPQIPDAQTKLLAQTMLNVKGAKPVKLGQQRPRFRS